MTFSTGDSEVLANYESIQLIKSQYQIRHGGTANTGKAREIATAFTQARGYLEAASSAARNVRPLLVYYAVLSFSRALTLFLSPNLREACLEQSHGLSVDGWGPELARDNGDVALLKIKINSNGTLAQLIEATNHESYLRNNYSIPNFVYVNDRPPNGAEVTLGDLLARLPEIRATLSRWRQNRTCVAFWPPKPTPDGGMEIRVYPPYRAEDIKAVFGAGFPITEQGGVLTFAAPKNLTFPALTDSSDSRNIGTLVAMTKYPGDFGLSKISTTFLVSYALGMLVRYYPSHWVGILHNHRHDSAMPSLLAALKYVQTNFPRLIVDFLERRPTSTPSS
jgi:hypothetical protein